MEPPAAVRLASPSDTLETTPSSAGPLADPGMGYAVGIGLIWVLVGALVALVAWATKVPLPPMRILAPYLTWPLMTPLLVLGLRRFPLDGRRALVVHLGLYLASTVLHGVVFRLFMLATGHGFAPWPTSRRMIVATLTFELAFYASTVGPMAAAGALARAQRRDLERAQAEASGAAEELDSALAQIGPGQLDALLGRVRRAIADPARDAEASVATLAAYLRAVMGAAEPAWTLDSELDAVGAYLAFERACSGRSVELVLAGDAEPSAVAVRRYAVLSAMMSVLDAASAASEEPRPLELHVEPGPATTTVCGIDARTLATLSRAEVAS
jgi:hypothetical protein